MTVPVESGLLRALADVAPTTVGRRALVELAAWYRPNIPREDARAAARRHNPRDIVAGKPRRRPND